MKWLRWPKPWWLAAVALLAVSFGALTVKEGASVLFVDGGARRAAGNYVPFVSVVQFRRGLSIHCGGSRNLGAPPMGGVVVVRDRGYNATDLRGLRRARGSRRRLRDAYRGRHDAASSLLAGNGSRHPLRDAEGQSMSANVAAHNSVARRGSRGLRVPTSAVRRHQSGACFDTFAWEAVLT